MEKLISIPRFDQNKYDLLTKEITQAINATPSEDLKKWALKLPLIFGSVFWRRLKRFGSVMKKAGSFVLKELNALVDAAKAGRALDHLTERGNEAVDATVKFSHSAFRWIESYSKLIISNPKEEAPKFIIGVLGFLVGGGGIDGEGGIPDMDIAFGGIGAHRSIFTHSIIAGSIIETISLGTITLTKMVHKNLPEQHDPLWDQIVSKNEEYFTALSIGLSAGIAYHLDIDATIDSAGNYHDLPISLPHEAHETIMAANAATETVDTSLRGNRKQ